MAEVLITAGVLCALSLLLGQGVLAALGRGEWSWLSPPTGLGLLLVITSLAIRLPGHAQASRIVVLLAAVGAAGILVRARVSLRPLLSGGLVALVVLSATMLPYAAAGRIGPLGVRVNADLPAHMLLADAVRVGEEAEGSPFTAAGYPTGPHALVATLTGLGTDVEASFAALMIAVPILTGLTALALLSGLPRGPRIVGAALVGMPYLCAAYLVQSSFKEPLLAFLLLGFALWLHDFSRQEGPRARSALAAGLMLGGCLATYSYTGLAWPAAIAGTWVVLELVARRRLPTAAVVRRAFGAAALACAVPLVAVLPDLQRIARFSDGVADAAEGITTGGNIRARIPGYEVLGVWLSEDFRVYPDTYQAGVLSTLALVVTGLGLVWFVRRRQLVLPAATIGCLVLYVAARLNTTPYYNAKALVIAAPLVMLLLVRAALDLLPERRELAGQGWLGRPGAGAALAIGFMLAATASSVVTLRGAIVGPAEHSDELAQLRPMLEDRRTLFLGQDDYVYWELRGARVSAPVAYIGDPLVPFNLRPEKGFTLNLPVDFDSLDRGNLDQFEYVVMPRSNFTSAPPPNWREVRTTKSYAVFERRGPTLNREILGEREGPGQVLDCSRPDHRSLSRRDGEASVRDRPRLVDPSAWRVVSGRARPADYGFAGVPNDGRAVLEAQVPVGFWRVAMQYFSPEQLRVKASSLSPDRAGAGLRTALPPSEEYAGPYWDLGPVLSLGRRVRIEVEPETRLLAGRPAAARLGTVVFTREGPAEVVPLEEACGRYVDWFRVEASPAYSTDLDSAATRQRR